MSTPLSFAVRAFRSLPHPKKRQSGGEDAYLLASHLLGVSDGVGSWASRGVNAGDYSRCLMKECYDYHYDALMQNDAPSARDVLEYAWRECESTKGSATAVLGVLNDRTLDLCSLGDSGLMVFRDGGVVFRTDEQQHSLNFPFQLGTGSADAPSDGALQRIDVVEGDVVLLATDGLLDNIYDDVILDTLVRRGLLAGGRGTTGGANQHHPREQQAQLRAVCNELVELAAANAQDRSAATPFAERCMEAGMTVEGGKVDDTTIVLARVSREPSYTTGERTNEERLNSPRPHALWPG